MALIWEKADALVVWLQAGWEVVISVDLWVRPGEMEVGWMDWAILEEMETVEMMAFLHPLPLEIVWELTE